MTPPLQLGIDDSLMLELTVYVRQYIEDPGVEDIDRENDSALLVFQQEQTVTMCVDCQRLILQQPMP